MLHVLREKSGNVFDNLYVKDQIHVHNEAIILFKKYLRNTAEDNQSLKTFADRTLPTLESHRQAIHSLKSLL